MLVATDLGRYGRFHGFGDDDEEDADTTTDSTFSWSDVFTTVQKVVPPVVGAITGRPSTPTAVVRPGAAPPAASSSSSSTLLLLGALGIGAYLLLGKRRAA